jgi:predicted DNA-binding ribbon-helix-helix protein
MPKSSILKGSIVVGGHRTGLSHESEFWEFVKDIAAGRETSLATLVEPLTPSAPGQTGRRRSACST